MSDIFARDNADSIKLFVAWHSFTEAPPPGRIWVSDGKSVWQDVAGTEPYLIEAMASLLWTEVLIPEPPGSSMTSLMSPPHMPQFSKQSYNWVYAAPPLRSIEFSPLSDPRITERISEIRDKFLQKMIADMMVLPSVQAEFEEPCVTEMADAPAIVDSAAEKSSRLLRIYYTCPFCGHQWRDEYEFACDDGCSVCGANSITPTHFEEI